MRTLVLLFWLTVATDAEAPPLASAVSSPDACAAADAIDPISTDNTVVAKKVPLPSFAIASVRTRAPVVALTFDACATLKQANTFDREIFEILKREQIPVTIFPTGRWIEAHPAEARELAAQPWVEFGNHSYSHVRMTHVPRRKAVVQIARTEELIGQLGRQSVAFRPPAGAWNRLVVRLAARQHLPTVQWDVASGDPGRRATSERIIKAVLSTVQRGSIVIFHINGRAPHTKEALPDIIRGLRERGLGFVTVSELLRQPDAQPLPARSTPYGHRPWGQREAASRRKAPLAHPPS